MTASSLEGWRTASIFCIRCKNLARLVLAVTALAYQVGGGGGESHEACMEVDSVDPSGEAGTSSPVKSALDVGHPVLPP